MADSRPEPFDVFNELRTGILERLLAHLLGPRSRPILLLAPRKVRRPEADDVVRIVHRAIKRVETLRRALAQHINLLLQSVQRLALIVRE